MAWKRYKDPTSGDEFTADELTEGTTGLDPLDKPAVDLSGRPLPPKKHTDLAGETVTNEPSKSWRLADLQAHAQERGIEYADGATKADILAALEAADSNAGA